MERLFKGLVMCVALGIAYEAGREKGARDMFFKWTEAIIEFKCNKENQNGSED